MPDPKWVIAVGTCAVSGGIAEGGYACGHGLDGLLPVDVWLPGCPPNPAAIIEALLLLLDRTPQRVHEGRHGK
jgi:NADH:ubiquinone oxidoreductase subunit B-like Fe-S oxidoreductase